MKKLHNAGSIVAEIRKLKREGQGAAASLLERFWLAICAVPDRKLDLLIERIEGGA